MSQEEIKHRILVLRQKLDATAHPHDRAHIMDEIIDWEGRLL